MSNEHPVKNMHLHRIPQLDNRQGQASFFLLAFLGVILVASIFLYQSGRLTSEKMELQNAADAAAFGASTLEARSLNFCAYTNRAMVANEVAIGQMVGMLSLADEIKSAGEYIEAYADAIDAALKVVQAALLLIPIAGEIADAIIEVFDAIVEVMEAVGETIKDVGEAIAKVLEVVATPVVWGLSINNEVYSVSQTLYHGATMVLVTTDLFKSLEDNTYGTSFSFLNLFKRDRTGAQVVSDMGLLALALHMPSYWSGYTKRYSSTKSKEEEKEETDIEMDEYDEYGRKIESNEEKKEKKKKKKKEKNEGGMGRLAATVREARDPFSNGGDNIRVKNFLGMEVEYKNRDWFLGMELDQHVHFLGDVLKFDLEEGVGLYSMGGSELRKKGDGFTWSALDTLLGGPRFKYDISLNVDPLYIHKHWNGLVEVGLPLGGGIAQAAKSAGGGGGGEDDEEGGGEEGVSSALTPLDFDNPLMELDFYNKDFNPYPYGGAGRGERFIMVDVASKDLEENTISGYTGLKA